MQIRMKDQLSADEALMLLEVANAEVASLHQKLAEQEKTIEQLQDANAALLAERDALREALEDELIWHEAQDKAISKQPNANTGHTWWRRMQHQEHAVVIRAALGQGQEEA